MKNIIAVTLQRRETREHHSFFMLCSIPTMLVFIDESGCAGFKFVRGSVEHFVVAMVAFRDRAVARRTDEIIRQTQIDLNIYPEFKFSDSRDARSTRRILSPCRRPEF